MKAVGRLLLTYFLGSPGLRWLTVSGLLLMLASVFLAAYLPQPEQMTLAAWPGLIIFFLGSALMPVTLGRLASSHAARILPGARVKLLVSAILTVMLVALPVGLITPIAFVAGMSADLSSLRDQPGLFQYTVWLSSFTYTSACTAATWLYVLIWFVSRERGFAGFAKTLVLAAVLLALPSAAHQYPDRMLQVSVLQLAVLAIVFSAGFLAWPRLQPLISRRAAPRTARNERQFAGREIDLLLGNAQPWTMIGALTLTMLAVAQQSSSPSPAFALFFLAMASCISGAMAGQVPARARLVWLLGDWTRPDLFRAVEKSTWRHNGFVVAALLLLFLGLGGLTGLPVEILVAGVPVVLVGAALSTYLGLMRTRGTGWVEGSLGFFVVAAMMGLGYLMGEEIIGAEIAGAMLLLLAALAFALRTTARRRWNEIDWSFSRNETQRALRVG